jgi:radial spoke head protein 1
MPPQSPPAANICTTATGGGPSDDYIQEQQYTMKTIPHPSPHPHHPNTIRFDMLSSVVLGKGVTAKRTAVITSEDKSIPGWIPKNPESSSTPPRPNPIVAVNDGDPSYKGERHPTTNLRHGFGIMSYRDGSVYTGNFEHDKRHGFGKCWYPDGLGVYTGFWANGQRNGLGKMVYSNGEVYHGEWLADLPYPADS